MNNIYVDELTKSCAECELNYQEHSFDHLRCTFTGEHCNQFKNMCPLKPLNDRLAEERKKVVQEIDCELYTKMVVYGDTPSYADIHSVLNKIKENSV